MRVASQLAIVKLNIPDWSIVTSCDSSSINITASPLLDGGIPSKVSYNLIVREENASIEILEQKQGNSLPSRCSERHINIDGTFCIRFNSKRSDINHSNVKEWWIDLEEFLKNQILASKHRRWPPGKWLSHGSAAFDHLELEKIAVELGWEKEVEEALEYSEGWLASELPRCRKNSKMLVNQRRCCPRGCKKNKSKKVSSIARRDCLYKDKVFSLVYHERQRRQKEEEFKKIWVSKGVVCCKTMDKCALMNSM